MNLRTLPYEKGTEHLLGWLWFVPGCSNPIPRQVGKEPDDRGPYNCTTS
jgi:hypothetical protein